MRLSRLVSCCVRLLSLTIATALLFSSVMADDWPHWRGPGHNGISSEKQLSLKWPQNGPKVLWKKSLGRGYSSVVVANGLVYTTGNSNKQDTVYCFDAATGSEAWKKSYACEAGLRTYPGTLASPTVDADRVYTFSRLGHLNCFDAKTGEVKWSRKVSATVPTYGLSSSPVISGKLVVLNVRKHGMAFDKMTGEPVWESEDAKPGYASPVPFKLADADTLLMFGAKAVHVVRVTDGKLLTLFPWKTYDDMNVADPVVIDPKTVLIASNYYRGGAVISFAGDTPKLIWKNKKVLQNHFNSTVHYRGELFGPGRTTLDCVDPKTGEPKWMQAGFSRCSLCVADGKLIIMSQTGELVIAEATADAYTELARAQVLPAGRRLKAWTMPVLSNGRIYCRNNIGDLVCIDVAGR